MTQFKALLVGNARFPADPHNLNLLNGPLNDVDALHDELTNPDTGIFECQPPLKDAPAQQVLATTADFFESAGRGDTLLFYYSGHGRVDTGNELYLCGYDTDTRTDGSPRIEGPRLAKFVANSPARLTIIILDCCHASAFKGGVWSPRYFLGDGRFVLAATRKNNPLVPDAPAAGELSPFTKRLIEALREASLDTDADGFITAHDVADHLARQAATQPDAPYALQHWTGTGIAAIALSGKRRLTVAAPAVVVPEPPVGNQPYPELIALPPGAAEPTLWLSRSLVTNGQYRAFLNDPANAAWRPETARREGRVDRDYLRSWQPAGTEYDNYPVVSVGAEAVEAYLEWAGERMDRALRLPQESEWLWAARAGRSGNWVTEDVFAGRVNCKETLNELTEVGEFQANPYGLGDLLGQVWEICLTQSGKPVLRGGAFNTPAALLLEQWALPTCREDVGFRCASEGMAP